MPKFDIVPDGRELYLLVEGVRIAKRGQPGSPQARTWISLEPGWQATDIVYPTEIEIIFDPPRSH